MAKNRRKNTTPAAGRKATGAKAASRARSKRRKPVFSVAQDLATGSRGPEVAKLQNFLKTFGYLEPDAPASASFAKQRDFGTDRATQGAFDDATEKALRNFQEYYGLPVTGRVDADTAHLVSMSRCGNPDNPNKFFQMRASPGLAEFVAQGNRWNASNVTYSFTNFTGDLTQQVIVANIRQAFLAWSRVCALTFTEIAGGADIAIGFFTGNHGDGSNFDGAGNVLAHGFFPPPNGGAIAGDLHFDDAERWTTNDPPTGIDFLTVAIHEIGHTLGLNHSADTSAIMFAFYGGIKRVLAADDIAGIRSIYGSETPKAILADTSITSPAFETFGNRGFIAWAGRDNANRLNVMATDDLRVWHSKVTLVDTSQSGPALAVFNGRLFMAWRGVGNNQLNVMSSLDGRTWTNKVTLGETTFHRPSLAVFNGQLFLAWTGTDSARRLNLLRSSNGTAFGGKITMNESSINGPSICPLGGRLLVSWTGTDANRRLNVVAFNGSSFLNKVTLGENSIAGPSIHSFGGNLVLAWTGTDQANRLNTLRSTNGVNFFGKRTFADASTFGPTISSMQGAPVLVWTGRDTAQSLNVMRV